jgi:hypothetical protein
MKKITNIVEYEAFDGTRFKDENKCNEYEKEITILKEIEEPLGKRKDIDCNSFVQHNLFTVRGVWKELVTHIQKSYEKDKSLKKHFDDALENPHLGPHYSFIGRFTDGDLSWHLMSRLMCIDFKTGKEYEQPYFALHPEEVK